VTVSYALHVTLARHLDSPLVTSDMNLVTSPTIGLVVIAP
jgi:predicted nucleic acid-binding protein